MTVPSAEFRGQLDWLETTLVHMAALVIEGIHGATEVLLDGDLEGAQTVIDADDELDLLSIEVEEVINRAMAIQSPVARDLRTLLAAVKLDAELERSGDLVTNIAKAVQRLAGVRLEPGLRGDLHRMREEACRLFEETIVAFRNRDAEAALRLRLLDDTLDELHREFIESVFVSHAAGAIDIQQAVQLSMLGRFYERLGDHAVNCGERIAFLVTGDLPEHTGAERARRRRDAESGAGR